MYKNPSASLVVRIGDSYWSFKEEISKDPIDNRLIEVAKYINGGFVPESGDLEKKFREQYEAERKGFVGHYTDLFKQKADKGLLSEFSAHRGVMGECKGDTDEDWWSSCHINATTLVKEPKTGKYCIISARDNAANGTTDKFSVDLIVKRSFFNEERKKIINMMYDNSPFGRDTIGELCSYAEARRPTRR